MDKTKTCEGCPDRVVGCQCVCPEYTARRAERQRQNAERIEKRRQSEDLRAATAIVRQRGIKKGR